MDSLVELSASRQRPVSEQGDCCVASLSKVCKTVDQQCRYSGDHGTEQVCIDGEDDLLQKKCEVSPRPGQRFPGYNGTWRTPCHSVHPEWRYIFWNNCAAEKLIHTTAAIKSLLTHLCISVALNIIVHSRLTYEHQSPYHQGLYTKLCNPSWSDSCKP